MPKLTVTILRLSNSRSKPVFVPLPSDDPKRRQPDIALAKAKLGWKPKVNLKDDLKRQFLIYQGR
jgi:UDP-glucuronate decarboxylase